MALPIDASGSPLESTTSMVCSGVFPLISAPVVSTGSVSSGLGLLPVIASSSPLNSTISMIAGFPLVLDCSDAPLLSHAGISATLYPYLYVCDSGNNRIQVWNISTTPATYAFSFGSYGSGNGQFNAPYGVDFYDPYVYVTDSGNNRIQVFTPLGVYVGQIGSYGTALGEFDNPMGIHVDDNFIWVVDNGNNRFQVIKTEVLDPIFTIGEYGSGENQFNSPTDCYGDVAYFYIVDSGNNRTVTYLKNMNLGDYLSATIPGITVAITGYAASGKITTGELPDINAYISGNTNPGALLSGILPFIGTDFSIGVTVTGNLSTSLFRLSSGFTLDLSPSASISGVLPGFSTSFVITFSNTGELTAYIQDITANLLADIVVVSGVVGGVTPTVIVINTMTKAVTEYSGYAFNSYVKFGSSYLAFGLHNGVEGIYELDDSDTEAGTDIDASFKTSEFDIYRGSNQSGSVVPRKISDIHVMLSAMKDIQLILQGNKDILVPKTFTIPGRGSTSIRTERVERMPRGAFDRFYDITVQNVDGSDFDIENIEVSADPLERDRRR